MHDSMVIDKPVYYIGTLVTFKRDENVFEVIDGQQRLTTIYIILTAMGEKLANRLAYSSRKTSTQTITAMSKFEKNKEVKDSDFGEEYDLGIKNGYNFAKEALKDVNMDKFKEYFLNHVHIIHYRVPKDVDLNHYFEVMNSRGEQLEKHEIVKAKLSALLEKEDMKKFCQIWEACSDMSFYIQQKLLNMYIQKELPNKKNVFGTDMSNFIPQSFEELYIESNHTDDKMTTKSIAELLNAPVKKEIAKGDCDSNDSFQPIIDFPNFLLIVLKITRMQEKGFNPSEFTLDDKELINEFDKVKLTPEFVKQFAYNLLLAKYYLDNYMVHHINGEDKAIENPWKLQYYCKKGKGKSAYMADLIDYDKSKQRELVHLLSMFEVAFTAKQRKNYLFYCLLYLFNDWDKNNYLNFVRNLANKYFFDVYLDANKLNERNQPKPNSFDETIIQNGKLNVGLKDINRNFNGIYPQGSSNIPLFVFNYTDYRLWKKYADELRGNRAKKGSKARSEFFIALGCGDFGLETFDDFYFSRTRKSLEHYYPQAKAGEDKPITPEEINCFGNFAMIGSDANSSGSNWNPTVKNECYLDSKSNQVSVASLKFRIMLQMCQDNKELKEGDKRDSGFEWNADDMQKHQEKILSIIMQPTH
ncbi:DUF262 domain-containing HNH endonuclease family protein [Prevotella copri]|uniref:DUF262 domain-containing HNH endonuclease family protein n=1 Tax=Segatella copri TaxID=165179 RepID=A0AAP3FBH5_9BACT|nr:DUF262 domain-containing HNH endonuclease family protein [Segatella copri]MCW4416152.1 DUF262 domain-containing HNH endonuclease family protein [Segatella copri]MCW4422666.1 DUF262 domain-containing HNH endonuclease family protein [Segatella copri]